MNFLRQAKDKLVETVVGHSIAPDEDLEGYKRRLSKLCDLVSAMRETFSRYAASVLEMSKCACVVSKDVARFYTKSPPRGKMVQLFTDSNFTQDSTAHQLFKEEFGWEVLKLFDDWNDEVVKIRKNIAIAEETRKRMVHVQQKVRRYEKQAAAQTASSPEAEKLKAARATLADLLRRFKRMKAALAKTVKKMIDGRFSMFDKAFVRLMEQQMSFFAAAKKCSDSLAPSVKNYRAKHPREPSSHDPPGVHDVIPEHEDHDEDAEEDDDGGDDGEDEEETSDIPNGTAATPQTPARQVPTQEDDHMASPEAASGPTHVQSPSMLDILDVFDEDDGTSGSPAGASGGAALAQPQRPVDTPASPGAGMPPVVEDFFGGDAGSPTGAGPDSDFDVSMFPTSQSTTSFASGLSIEIDSVADTRSNHGSEFDEVDPFDPYSPAVARNDMGPSASAPPTRPRSDSRSHGNSPNYASGSVKDDFGVWLESSQPEADQGDAFVDDLFGGGGSSAISPSDSTTSGFGMTEHMADNDPVTGQPRGTPTKKRQRSQEEIDAENAEYERTKKPGQSKLDWIIERNQRSAHNHMTEVLAQQEQELEARQDAASDLSETLKAWRYKSGTPRDIRALLSSLQTVLWEDASWKTVTIADLIDNRGVKKAYRKAIMLVHPDKNRGKGARREAISHGTFEALNEAMKNFE